MLLFLYIAEIGRFKAKHGQGIKKRDHGIYQGHFPELRSSYELMGEIGG
jgi:hypothetical protein